jgi:hypothetical protein
MPCAEATLPPASRAHILVIHHSNMGVFEQVPVLPRASIETLRRARVPRRCLSEAAKRLWFVLAAANRLIASK